MIDKLIPALGWMLVHSLWQGAVLALLAALVLSLFRQAGPVFHYRVFLFSMFSFVLAAVTTFFLYWNIAAYSHTDVIVTPVIAQLSELNSPAASSFRLQDIPTFITTHSSLLVLGWFLFFCFRGMKNLAAWLYARRICRQEIYSPPAEWEDRFKRLVLQMNIKSRVRLLESGKVLFPVTMGFLKPVVLMPLGVLYALPPAQVELVLRHELAHIRRHDYLVNLLQLLTESLFFFNPGLLWLSAQLREQREFCCDDIAVAGVEHKEEFLSALLYFKSLTVKRMPVVIGLLEKPSQLRKRVIRILEGSITARPYNIAAIVYTIFTGVLLLIAGYNPGGSKTDGIMVKGSIVKLTPELVVLQEKLPTTTEVNALRKPTAPKKQIKKVAEEVIPMDSTTLSMLTGEFNTMYKGVHYIIGVAKSSMTYLTVNGKTIAPDQWHQYANVFAGIVNQFKSRAESPVATTQQQHEHSGYVVTTPPVAPG